MQVKKEFVIRALGEDYVIIPTGKTTIGFHGLITVNEVGAFLWQMLQKEVTEEELLQGILAEYDVEEEIAREDIQDFLDVLVRGEVLVRNE